MSEAPNKNDIEVIFKKLRSIPTNKECFDCNSKNPTWASVTFGVFICIDCSAVHRGLGVHLTFVRSTQLDTNWTWVQLRQMQLGGNANAISFFNQHNCTTKDAQQKYNSRAAQLYREKLQHAAVAAMKVHGTKLFIDPIHDRKKSTGEDEQEADFFAEHTNGDNFGFEPNSVPNQKISAVSNITTSISTSLAHPVSNNETTGAPNVEKAFSEAPIKTSSLGAKKIQTKKPSGLGGKKLGKGLGAQKVKTNFAEIEKEAELADQIRTESQSQFAVVTPAVKDNEEVENLSMRLAYQDISKQQKKEEEKLKQFNPKKAEQIERLGMGFSSVSRSGGVSHSVLNDSEDIQQEVPTNAKESRFSKSYGKSNKSAVDILDDWTLYSEGGNESSSEDDYYSRSSKNSSSTKPSSTFQVSSSYSYLDSVPATKPSTDYSSSKKSSSSTTSAPKTSYSNVSTTPTDVQKKFGSAKSISSSQYFGDSGNSFDTKSDLARFEGSSSISSADFFGHDSNPYGNSGGYVQGPDLDDVKESVRQGVTKVAGKLSSLANGVMSSIQEKYGGY